MSSCLLFGLFRQSHPLLKSRTLTGERTWPWVLNDRIFWEHKERTARNRKRQGIASAAQKQLPQRHSPRATRQKNMTVRERKNCLSSQVVCCSSKGTEASGLILNLAGAKKPHPSGDTPQGRRRARAQAGAGSCGRRRNARADHDGCGSGAPGIRSRAGQRGARGSRGTAN